MKTLSDLFKEYFEVGMLPERDQAKYRLIDRYSNRVSPRLIQEQQALRLKGSDLLRDYLSTLASRPMRFPKLDPIWNATATIELPTPSEYTPIKT